MSQPASNDRIDSDPLLQFSLEPNQSAAPPAEPPQQDETVAPSVVAPAPQVDQQTADALAALTTRVDKLEKSVDDSAQQVANLKSDVATLVAVASDIKKRIARTAATPAQQSAPLVPQRTARIAGAIAGVAAGITIALWFWSATSHEPIVSQQAAVVEPVNPPLPIDETTSVPAESVVAKPAIVPVAAVTPARATAPRIEPRADTRAEPRVAPRDEPRIITYVGTLSIDADPGGQVFIDRKLVGRTPHRAENLRAGAHLIWIERDGYRRFTRVVQVPADRVTRLVADLEPATR